MPLKLLSLASLQYNGVYLELCALIFVVILSPSTAAWPTVASKSVASPGQRVTLEKYWRCGHPGEFSA